MIARHVPLAAAGVAVLILSGCAGAGAAGPESGVQVVASTDVYGDIAAQIGGAHVDVTAIISGVAVDPHSYEATVQDELALSRAELVVGNGGGYDPFVESMIANSGADDVVVLSAVEASGLQDPDDEHANDEHADEAHGGENVADEEHADDEHGHIGGFNEHVWYSLHGMHHLADEIAQALSEIDPDNAPDYERNAAAFTAEIEVLEKRADDLRAMADGARVVATEPVAVYLLEDVGLENVTPDEFAESLEEGIDVSPTVLQETLDLVSPGTIALLAYNGQTSDPVTDQLRDAADSAGVPVVSLSETLPDGADYLGWMESNLDAIEAGLR